MMYAVTVKLARNPDHNPKSKVIAACPLTGLECTDQTGEHHTEVVQAETSAEVRDFYALRDYHVTRIEQLPASVASYALIDFRPTAATPPQDSPPTRFHDAPAVDVTLPDDDILFIPGSVHEGAVRGVLNLHSELKIYGPTADGERNYEDPWPSICAECSEAEAVEALADNEYDEGTGVRWPCSTVKAITGAGVSVGGSNP